MNTTDEIMGLVEAYAAECAEYEAPTISPRYAAIQSAFDDLQADNASLREQNTALDAACAELDRANLSFAKRELWWNEKMFELEEKLKWAHHTPKLLSDADAAADLAGLPRPGAEPVEHLVAIELERIAQDPPVNGNEIAQARVLMAARSIREFGLSGGATAPPQASQPAQDAVDDLQGAATWLCTAIDGCDVADIQQRLSIGYNRAKRLLDASIATQKGQP